MFKILTFIDFICFFLIYIFVFLPKWKKGNDFLLKTLLYIYLTFVIYFTLMPLFIPIPFINMDFSYFKLNLNPFVDIINSYGNPLKEFILNVIMTIPFGILLSLTYRTNLFKTTIYTFLLSFMIEFLQLIHIRKINSADVTDLVSNTIGGIIGYFIYLILKKPATYIIKKINIKKQNINEFDLKAKVIIIIIVQYIVRSILYRFI